MVTQFFLYLPLVIYLFFLMWVVYVVVSGNEATTAETYALGDKSYKRKVVFLTLAATMIGPSYSMGVVERSSDIGFLYTIFFILSMIQLFVVGTYFAEKIQFEAKSSRTVGDIIGSYYDKYSKLFAGIATVGQALAFTGVLCLGAAQVMNAVFSLPLDYGITATALVVGAYAVVGGMPAVLKTDAVQFGFLLAIAIFGVISSAIIFYNYPDASLIDNIGKFDTTKLPTNEIISTSVAFLLGEAFIPVYSVRGLLSESGFVAKKGFQYASYFGIGWFITLGIFGIASLYIPENSAKYNITLFNVVSEFTRLGWLNALVIGITTTGILGIVMSTLDSVLNAGAISFTRDIMEFFTDLNEEEEFSYDKYAVILIAIFGTSFTIFSEDIVDILILGYTVWVPTIVFPFAYCLIKRNEIKNKYSAISGIIGGILGYIIGEFLNIYWLPPILLGLIFNIIIFLICEAMKKK